MSKSSKKFAAGGEQAVAAGREEEWSENAALNVDFKSKVFYMYREVILLLLISFRQDDVSQFLFKSSNNDSLKRFFTKDGTLSIIEFDKVVWFLVNNQQYVSDGCNNDFLRRYPTNFLKSNTFNIIQASKSISIIICRYLYTIIKTNQNQNQVKKSKRGGMMSLKKRLQPEDAELSSSIDIYVPTIPTELKDIIDSSSKHIVENCETIEAILEEPYLNLNNIDPIPENFTDSTLPPKIIEQDTNEEKIDNNIEPIRIKDDQYNDVLNLMNPSKDKDKSVFKTYATSESSNPEKRRCDRFVQLAQKERLHKAIALDEEEKTNKIKLELAIKAKQELDDAISKAGGETYKGIKLIDGVYYPRDETEKIGTRDDKLLPVLAMKQKSLEVGARSKLTNNMIPNKVSVVKFLVELGLISASGDIDDDEDDEQGGGGHSNYKQYGNAGPNIKTKKGKQQYNIKDSVKLAEARGSIEGIGAQNQCGAAIGSLTHIPRVKCYICGELGGIPNMKTMECEHIFCVGLAAQYFGLLRAASFSEQQKRVLSILYAWSHRCCNQLKSNLSFMKFKSKPNENAFEFHETNAKELLRNIYGNTVKYDCEWVDKQIIKVYPLAKKPQFITDRTHVLGRYCRPLIQEINAVRTQMFHFSPQLFSFMSILKVAATTLVLLTGENKEPTLKLKSKETLPLCRLLLMKDLETIKVRRGGRGGGRKNNKIQYGGEFDYDGVTTPAAYNVNWAQLMKFMIQSKYSTLDVERPSAVSEEGLGINYPFIFTISEDNVTKYVLPIMEIMLNTNINKLLDIVNTYLFNNPRHRGNITELQPGTFIIIAPDKRKVDLSVFNTLYDAMRAEIFLSEDIAQIEYIPLNNGPGTVVVDHTVLNNPIFRLLALNHQINPYSLIAALLYNNEDRTYSDNMLASIDNISGDFNPESYTRCQASVILLKTLLVVPKGQIPAQILDEISLQDVILDRIKEKLLVEPSVFHEYKQAINAILLIVYPDELPVDDDTSKDDEIIDDILTFIHHDNKNTLYSTLILDAFKIVDLMVFKQPTPKEIEHDGKFDEDDGGDGGGDGGGDDGMAYGVSRASRPNDVTIVSRIRNLLIVIAGVYFAYGYDSFGQFIGLLIHVLSTNSINLNMLGSPTNTVDYFKQLLNILITRLKQHTISSNYEDLKHIWYPIVVKFFNEKLILYTNEQSLSHIIHSRDVGNGLYMPDYSAMSYSTPPLTPVRPSESELDSSITASSPSTSPDYSAMSYSTPPLTPVRLAELDSSITASSLDSSPDASQPLLPDSNPPPQQDIEPALIVELLNGIESSIREDTENDSIFDTIIFENYLYLFTSKVNRDNTDVSLRFQPPPGGDIQESIDAIKSVVDSPSHGGKANKKKSTKRRTPRHRQHKRSQYSKKKRNTSSKRKKCVSIKHKKSRTKYHDTRKRRK